MFVLFLSPIVISYLLIFFYPTLRSFYMAFFKIPGLSTTRSQWKFVGFDNFTDLFGRQLFKISCQNILVIALVGGIFVFTVSLFFAWVLQKGMFLRKFWRNIIYLPTVITPVAMVVVWTQYAFNNRFGLLKRLFDALGLHTLADIPWTSPAYAFWAMLIAYCFGCIGGTLIIFMASMDKIPTELYEAAFIDGAKEGQAFFRITLPLIKDNIKTQVIFWGLGCIGFFLWSKVFSVNDGDPATLTPANYMYGLIFGNSARDVNVSDPNVGLGTAVGVCLCLASVVVFAVVNWAFGKEKYEF